MHFWSGFHFHAVVVVVVVRSSFFIYFGFILFIVFDFILIFNKLIENGTQTHSNCSMFIWTFFPCASWELRLLEKKTKVFLFWVRIGSFPYIHNENIVVRESELICFLNRWRYGREYEGRLVVVAIVDRRSNWNFQYLSKFFELYNTSLWMSS